MNRSDPPSVAFCGPVLFQERLATVPLVDSNCQNVVQLIRYGSIASGLSRGFELWAGRKSRENRALWV